jgi:hypothetical protein
MQVQVAAKTNNAQGFMGAPHVFPDQRNQYGQRVCS